MLFVMCDYSLNFYKIFVFVTLQKRNIYLFFLALVYKIMTWCLIYLLNVGAVELENLPLKKDSLRQIGLPVEVRAGLIGKVKLKIPVSQITSAPWEIYMDQLYIVVGPVRLTEVFSLLEI